MNLLHDISAGKKAPEEINVVVENCRGSSNKIEYDVEEGAFKLDRVLYSAVFWPFDYGFSPRTWQKDEDPLDVVVLTTYATFPGCVIEARPIGLLVMEDEKGIDDKIVAVPIKDPRFGQIKDISDVLPHTLKEIQEFFETYKKLEPGKFVKFKAWKNSEEAKMEVREAVQLYEQKFRR